MPYEPLHAWDIILRLTAATLAGSLLGLNREIMGKPAGLRTHALVSLGAALMAVITLNVSGTSPGEGLSRVMQGVITGIGFLGAGVILRNEAGKVTGLTTAAMIWIAAVLGLAAGAGRWVELGVATVLTFLVLLLERWENRLHFRLSPPNGGEKGNGEHVP